MLGTQPRLSDCVVLTPGRSKPRASTALFRSVMVVSVRGVAVKIGPLVHSAQLEVSGDLDGDIGKDFLGRAGALSAVVLD